MKKNLNKTEKSTKKRTYYVIQCQKHVQDKPAYCSQIEIYPTKKEAMQALKDLYEDWIEDKHEWSMFNQTSFDVCYEFNGRKVVRYYFVRKLTYDKDIRLWSQETL